MPKAYAIFIRESEIVDPAAMAAYKASNTGPVPGLTPLVVYGELENLEGAGADGMVVLEFPSMQEARDWYYGEYNERAKLRQQAAPHRAFLVEGI